MLTKEEHSNWLTNNLTEKDLYYSSPSIQFRVKPKQIKLKQLAPVTKESVAELFKQAKAIQIENPIMFGLVPFDINRPASLTIPHQYQCVHVPKVSPKVLSTKASRPKVLKNQAVPSAENYKAAVRQALKYYDEGSVEKIVLARTMDVYLDGPFNYEQVLNDLISRNRHGYNFTLPMWQLVDKKLQHSGNMLAASPELLVRKEGLNIFVNPLAGSIGRHDDPAIDKQRYERLAVSDKDLREHAFVVDDIVKNLAPFCSELNVPKSPSIIGTDALWHLSTFITGKLKGIKSTALELSCALHPTPAICGHPTAIAFQHIMDLEGFDRDYFAGLAGWQKENGDGEWVLTLRCARHLIDKHLLRLYAGAGTVAGSDPESEAVETATKMETFMRAIA